MLNAQVDRYLSLRRAMGFRLERVALHLRAYARFASERGEAQISATSAMAWAALAQSPRARHIRLRDVVKLAQFLRAEDTRHEVPPLQYFRGPNHRPLPYIYTPEEISRIIGTTSHLRATYPLRREGYATLFGLLAATGLRLSEALSLRCEDVLPEAVLHIRSTKFDKSRLVPLHQTTKAALNRYSEIRRRVAILDDHFFLSARNGRLSTRIVNYTFRRILKQAQIAPERTRSPRLMDLRHTFATRALEKCSAERRAVSRHFVALSTYLGHVDIKSTYWYLEATPALMMDISAAAEQTYAGGGSR